MMVVGLVPLARDPIRPAASFPKGEATGISARKKINIHIAPKYLLKTLPCRFPSGEAAQRADGVPSLDEGNLT